MSDLYSNPIVIKIQNGTIRSDTNLCRSCANCHRVIGISGREMVTCGANYMRPIRLSEPVAICTRYIDKSRPSLNSMQDIAWTLMTDKGGRKLGFQSPEQRKKETPSEY